MDMGRESTRGQDGKSKGWFSVCQPEVMMGACCSCSLHLQETSFSPFSFGKTQRSGRTEEAMKRSEGVRDEDEPKDPAQTGS